MESKERVTLNISGTRFQTTYSTLERFSGTRLALLASLRRDDSAYDIDTNEFFFERNPEVFSDVLQYYRTEQLHIRSNVCGNVVQKEFEFWGMFEQDIEPCCWTTYSKAQECKETLAAIDSTFLTGPQKDEQPLKDIESEPNAWIRFRRKVWVLLEDPSTSIVSKAYVIGHRVYVFSSMFLVILSIACFITETWEDFRVPINGANKTLVPSCTKCCGQFIQPSQQPGTWIYDLDDTEPHPVLVYIDYVLFSFFLLELLLRIFFTPSFRKYFTDFLNWIDVICVLTHGVGIILSSLENLSTTGYTATLIKTVLILRILRGLRIVRILRIFKLVKHYNAFKILVYTIKISLRELLLMIVFLLVGAVIFGSVIHVVEKENFRNIPSGLWWALVTMTTVGYGDMVPRQTAGFTVGCVCVITGVLTIAFTVPIVVNNFALYYSHAQSRNKKPKDYWKQKRVPQKLEAEPRLENVFMKAALAKKLSVAPSKKGDLFSNGTMLNNLNHSTTKSAYDNEKWVKTPDSTDFNVEMQEPIAVAPISAKNGPRFFAKRNVMTPVEEVEKEKNEEHSRQLLAQAEENDQLLELQKSKLSNLLAKRKAALAKKKQNEAATVAAAPAPQPSVLPPQTTARPVSVTKPVSVPNTQNSAGTKNNKSAAGKKK